MKYMIGIDAGGTSVKGKAFDKQGQELWICQAGFGNLVMDYPRAKTHLKQVVAQIQKELGRENCQGLVLGIAGLEASPHQEDLKAMFVGEYPVYLLNDGQLALYAALQGEEGILAIAGTGSIVLGYFNNEMTRVGGWGQLLGDEGSAYSIGIHLLKSVLNRYDKACLYSQLEVSLLAEKVWQDVFDLSKWVYQATKDQIADLARLVADHADKGDAQAEALLYHAGLEIAEQIIVLLNRYEITSSVDFKVYLAGSLVQKNDQVFESVCQQLETYNPRLKVQRLEEENVKGAYYYFVHKEREQI
ncbi:hypothetical protein HZY91_02320 [Facklamia sp. DSM 111018]|uniref:ATPase BadF/BadG/BcrA/BcrD type domain-containing protein n=2 Tax=Facklamia lactis TaxID=2749967 RepID=A0ABS0LQT1_9LACT|nr:hypothetical protein [Facklamia lactis]